jgi:hypothetical protein
MEHEKSINHKTANSDLGAVRRSAFIITIDDEYCKWEYGFNPKNADDISIEEITKVLEEHFDTKMVYAKLISVD